MAATPSKMIPLGTEAPYFNLYDPIAQKYYSLDNFKEGKQLLVMFICNHCPYVMHIIHKLVEVSSEYIKKGVNIVAINPNDYIAYPEDSPEKMVEYALKFNYPFPYLIDETQEVARSYDAACTPDFFLFDKDLKLVYRGQFDDSRPGNNIPPTGKDLTYAMDCLLNNKAIDIPQKPSLGCSIKWKS
jgi:thiol-disulfide isomerase/thioredoxin